MNFLTPLFLIGGAAIAGPILYHLIRRTTRQRTVFSSLMFLLPSPPRISKRHKLEHILLLILRCLALALLALGFSRPFFRQAPLVDPTASAPKRIVVLVDTSASMRREGLWAAARERVDEVLKRAGPVDHVALFTFARQTTELVSFDEWNRTAPGDRAAMVSSRLAAVTPSWSATHLGNALIGAAEALAETDTKMIPGPRQIALVSDLQAGSRLDTLQAYEWPKGIELMLEPVKARTLTNAGLQLVAEGPDASRSADAAPTVRVRVSNSTDAKREQFKVGWARNEATAEFVGPPIDAYVPPGQSRVFALPVPKTGAAERIVLRGDDDDFDNSVYVIPPAPQRTTILWLGSDGVDDTKQPLFFLRRAFPDTPRLAVQVIARAPAAPLVADEIANAAAVFVTEPLSPGASAALREQVLAGKTLVFAPKTTEAAGTLGALFGREAIRMEDARPSNYAMFAEIDFQHPLFAPFADPRFSDFTKIHIWKYRKLDAAAIPDGRVVAKFDSGDPAIIEAPLGKGRVLILTSGWEPEDSQLAISSKFVPLMWSLLELSGGINNAPTQFFIGDKVVIPADRAATGVRDAAGAAVTLPAGAKEFEATTQPGIYETLGGTKALRFAVNLDSNESRTTPLSSDELDHLGVPIAQLAKPATATAAQDKKLMQAVEAEGRQKLWRWFIAATLAVLLFESALAGWSARRLNLQTQEAAP
jgi:hypothetical protein